MKKDALKSIIVLISISLVIAVAMAAVNMITKDKIAAAEAAKKANAMTVVMEENGGFEAVTGLTLPEFVSEIWRDLDGEGYVVLLDAKGYDSSKPMSVAVGLSNDGKILKCEVISCSGETTGIGTKVKGSSFLDQFRGKDQTLDGVDTIGGATISSSGLIHAVRQAFDALEMAKEAAK